MVARARKVLRNGQLVTPKGVFLGDVVIEGDKIADVVPGGVDEAQLADAEVFDATGCWVYPGFIDAHTHMQCWTGMDWTADSFETGTRAAACGGTTTIVDYATQDKGMTLHQALDEWHKRADGTCTANYAFHMAIADWNDHTREEIADMRDAGITSFKTYFAYDHLRLDDAQTMEVLEAIKPFDGILCVHCENGTLVNELQRRVLAEGITGPEGHPLSRPAECEAEAISRLMYLSELTGARVNVVHCSTRLGLEQVRAARERGVRVSLETCPQYLLLDDTRYLEQGEDGFAGAKYVMSPPLRKPTDIAALREAVADGEVDQISTDHCSFNLHGQKDRGRGDFTKIPQRRARRRAQAGAHHDHVRGAAWPHGLPVPALRGPGARVWHVPAQGRACRRLRRGHLRVGPLGALDHQRGQPAPGCRLHHLRGLRGTRSRQARLCERHACRARRRAHRREARSLRGTIGLRTRLP
jgi:dihydropyrimidinase